MSVAFYLNGEPVEIDARPDERLADILRERQGLMGTKIGCGIGRCGACSVIMNGEAVNACLVMAWRLEGARVVTIEGLTAFPEGRAVMKAFSEGNAFQCGYCAPGVTVAMTAHLMRGGGAGEEAIREALGGNLCRCTGYGSILRAAIDAAKVIER